MKNKLFPTLSGQLTLWYTLAFSFFLLLAFFALFRIVGSILDRRIDEDLVEDVEEFRILYRDSGMDRLVAEIARESASGATDEFFIQLLDRRGAVVTSSNLEEWRGLSVDKRVVASLSNDGNYSLHTIQLGSHEFEARVIYGSIEDNLTLFIGESTEQKAEIMQVLMLAMIAMLALVIPSAAAVGRIITRRAVSGIEAVSRTAAHVDHGALDARVDVDAGSEEVERLARAFNAMLDRIRNLVTEMRELTDNVAHDLRSPLARIRALSETVVSDSGSSEAHKATAVNTIEECDRLLQMINTTLDISELEAGTVKFHKQKANISDIVHDACELFEPLAEQKGLTFRYQGGGDCQLSGNLQSLQRLLANLLDNAVKYTPEGGNIEVHVDCSSPNIVITVEDSGAGIPKGEQAQIFERFYRCDQSRSQAGCGLGLSFARAVARAHGGNISVDSSPGKGSIFTVLLPKAAEEKKKKGYKSLRAATASA